MMKPRYTAFALTATLAALSCLPHPVAAAENELMASLNPDDSAYLQLYFSEDQMFESATRTPKPLAQVPENVSIITAEQIKKMNAQTLYDVIEQTSGLSIDYYGKDFGSDAYIMIQGADFDQMLVLIDGIRFNSVTNGFGDLNGLPVQIVERIEIIKGPASSTWGSSLGGVINIITKEPGGLPGPQAGVSTSYGEGNSRQVNAELRGRMNRFGYYLYGGRQASDGLRDDRFFENNSFYGKLSADLPQNSTISATFGVDAPELHAGDFWAYDFSSTAERFDRFATASFESLLTDTLSFSLSLHTLAKANDRYDTLLGTGDYGESGVEPLSNYKYDEASSGGSSRLVWKGTGHTVVLGGEYDRGHMDSAFFYGPAYGGPFIDVPERAYDERWAIHLNDTFSLGKLSLIPGLRYDMHSISKGFVSPSLGATYRLGDTTLLRGAIAQGFNSPFLALIAGAPLYWNVNPDLDPLTVLSYQAGMETLVRPWLHAKASLFLHEVDDVWAWDDDNAYYINDGKSRRRGFEIEVETASFHHLSMRASYTYVHAHDSVDQDDGESYDANIILNYDNPRLVKAQLFGHFIHWSTEPNDSYNGKFDTMLFNLNLARSIFATAHTDIEFFLTVRNLFDAAQYSNEFYKNSDRSIEGGLRLLLF